MWYVWLIKSVFNHKNAITERHSNGSKLNLNKRGTPILPNTFIKLISSFTQWQFLIHNLTDRGRSDRFIYDNYKAKEIIGNSSLKSLRKRNYKKLFLAHLKINSVKKKLDLLTEQITGNVDMLMFPEIWLDSRYLEGQVLIPKCHVGSVILFVSEDSHSKLSAVEN